MSSPASASESPSSTRARPDTLGPDPLNSDRSRLDARRSIGGATAARDGAGRPYRCGRVAARALAAATEGRTVACTRLERDRYHRQVALCTADGRDLAEAMVRAGHAVELAEYSHGRYTAAEREARAARRGLWAGTFEPPAAWRHGRGW